MQDLCLHQSQYSEQNDRQADRCKNITLPQTSFAGGNEAVKTSGHYKKSESGALPSLWA